MDSDAFAHTSPQCRTTSYESRREREFYRYYEPIRALTANGPSACDVNDGAAVAAHKPVSSPDKALTAFCQLAALRLDAQRAMMFFFDTNYSYVLAESTRTLSLQDDSFYGVGDELWLGHTVIPRGCSVCEYTVKLPATFDGMDVRPINIVKDLSKDSRFCDRPYVVDKPRARFYAGVPISSNGVNIGAFCVLDDKPRAGLDQASILFLQDMAVTVMSHLDMVRAKVEHKRATQMVNGLNTFMESTVPFHRKFDTWSSKQTFRNRERSSTASDVRHRAAETNATVSNEQARRISSSLHDSTVLASAVKRTESFTSKPQAQNLQSPTAVQNVQSPFHKAASLIRDAIEVDNVMFLDASIGTYGGLRYVSASRHSSSYSLDVDTSDSDTKGRRKDSVDQELGNAMCSVLGHCSHACPDGNKAPVDDESLTNTVMSEKFLHQLLKRYPRGRCWNFDDQGNTSSNEDCEDDHEPAGDASRSRPSRRRSDHGRTIRQLYPDVRSFAVVGVWDQTQARWFAACILLSYNPLRLLSNEHEVAFVTAFGEVVMAEVQRLKAHDLTNSKIDFVSSISHELRSPLHGILGSVDCLHEHAQVDDFSKGLITQIDICGRTLLDTVDHILDFSNINHYVDGRGQQGTEPASLGSLRSLRASVPLDALTEEAVDAAVYSFTCSRDPQAILDRKVTVILDIDCSPEIDWTCNIATGSWRRLCMNLVSNALKFTCSGYVKISLGHSPSREPGKAFDTVLTISDSGCGMSTEFLNNHLFGAFIQEDGLIEGTGLGMNLVGKISKSLGGTTAVQSQKGVGTIVTTKVSIDVPQISPGGNDANVSLPRPIHQGQHIGLVGFESLTFADKLDVESTQWVGKSMLLESLERNCNGLGARISTSTSRAIAPADLYIISEADVARWREPSPDLGTGELDLNAFLTRPVIVVCNNAISERRLRSSSLLSEIRALHVEFLPQPVGPGRLHKAIQACRDASADAAKLPYRKISALPSRTEDSSEVPEPVSQPIPIRPRNRETDASGFRSSESVNDRDSPLGSSVDGGLRENSSPEFQSGISAGTPPVSPFTQVPATFTVPKVVTKPQSPSIIPSPEASGSKPIVPLLLVDDNEINLKILVNYAKKTGHPAITARDGLQAVEAYKKACYGVAHLSDVAMVILMDINMPVLNGFEATQRIRHFEQQGTVKNPALIIAVTGLGSATAQEEAYRSGMNRFLTKPLRLKQLSDILQSI